MPLTPLDDVLSTVKEAGGKVAVPVFSPPVPGVTPGIPEGMAGLLLEVSPKVMTLRDWMLTGPAPELPVPKKISERFPFDPVYSRTKSPGSKPDCPKATEVRLNATIANAAINHLEERCSRFRCFRAMATQALENRFDTFHP